MVTLSTEDNIKLLKQLESDFKRTINWNKQSINLQSTKLTGQAQNRHLDYLIYPSFPGVNRLFVLLFENKTNREVHTGYYIPKVEINDYSVVIDGRNIFDQSIKNGLKTYDNIRKIVTVQGDDYTTGCLLHYPYFKEHYNLVVIDPKTIVAGPKAIQQINFTWNLDKNATIFFIIQETKEAVLDFSKGIVKVLWFYFVLM